MGLLAAILDAIHGEDERIAGVQVTRLTTPLLAAEVGTMNVESTLRFGETLDGGGEALVIVGGEIILATGRTATTFTGLTRGVDNTNVPNVHPITTNVYDYAQNTSAIDHLRRAFLLDFAIGEDINVIGRNLGLERCDGLTDEQWRELIKLVAYMPKQPLDTYRQVLDVVFPGQYDLITDLLSKPYTVRVDLAVSPGSSKKGRFFLNGGEAQLTTGLLSVNTDDPILPSTHIGNAAVGSIIEVSGGFHVDGENFVLDDGVNPAVTFEYDDNASVIQNPVLRAINFTAGDSDATIALTALVAINNAPTLAVTASPAGVNGIDLVNDALGIAGNVPITTTVADTVFAVSGMAGGIDVGAIGVFGVFDDTPLTRLGYRLGFTNYFTGGSFVGSTITLGSSPGAVGTAVLIDYIAFNANYLADDETIVDDDDFYAYLGDDTVLIRCLLDMVRAAGIKVDVGLKI